MECGESIVCGSGELDLDPDIVSEEAGKLYSELQVKTHHIHHSTAFCSLSPFLPLYLLAGFSFLCLFSITTHTHLMLPPIPPSLLQTVIETHGVGVVESLVPILVWVLEGLASCRAQLREREEEAEREKGERDELLERYQSEKLLRRESQEVRGDGSVYGLYFFILFMLM